MSTEEIRMNPENTGGTPTPEGGAASSPKPTDPNLADELREFGKQIETLFNTARASTRGKEVEQQLTAAWRDVEKGVNAAITKAQSSDFKGTVQGTAQYAADEAQSGLARGLRGLNQWMSQKLNQVEENRKKRETAASYAATHGTADNEVADRFNSEAPVFGKDIHVPATPVHVTPDEKATDADNPIADRFNS
ncbi:MAG: hypothetical protein HY741_04220 [Chloroflexi bacterium]|nr:hypothetical protein [Chloroflexota bacterium]